MDESWKETPECFGKMQDAVEKHPCAACETDTAQRCMMLSLVSHLKGPETPPVPGSLGVFMPQCKSRDEIILERLKIWQTPEMPAVAWNTLTTLVAVGFSRTEAFQILMLLLSQY